MTSDPVDFAQGFAALAGSRSRRTLIRQVEVRLLQLPIREALVAGHGTHHVRDLTVVRIVAADGSIGWGECAALPTAGYWPETATTSFGALVKIAPTMVDRSVAEVLQSVDWAQPAVLINLPMARAAIEMSLTDLVLRSANVSLAEFLGVRPGLVSAGATVGIGPIDDVVRRFQDLSDEGFGRIKVKIEPGHDVAVVRALTQAARNAAEGRDQSNGPSIQVDANATFAGSDNDIRCLFQLAEADVEAIEQPFPAAQVEAARKLVRHVDSAGLPTRILVDEQASTVEQAVEAVETGSAHGAVVKPSRLGGIGAAIDLLARGRNRGFVVTVGGMMESGLGRHALAVVAALADQQVGGPVGDLSPARRWLAEDPWSDIDVEHRAGQVMVAVPGSPGVAPLPDLDCLDRHTSRRWSSAA